ncbi:MAG: efflux RND transporter permease subunit [Pseudomonadota bacterium]
MLGDYLRNGRFLALSIALLIVAGLAAITVLPRTEDPQVLNRMAFIITPFPGATPERVESLVSEPIEKELRRLPEVKETMSTSRAGLSVVRIELKDNVKETKPVWSRARDFLDDVVNELPAGAGRPEFNDDRGYAFTLIAAITWKGPGELDLGILGRYAEELDTRVRGVPGTDLARLYGQPTEEILIEIDGPRLTALGLSPQQVAEAVARSDAKVAAGALTNGANRLQVEVAGELDSLARVQSIPVRVDPEGETVRVSDVAWVTRGIEDPPADIAIVDGQRAVVLGIRMVAERRVDQWRDAVLEAITEFENGISSNVGIELLFDQNAYTSKRLGDLVLNVLMGFGLIVVVLMVTLGLRAALVVALALPLTAAFTLTVMNATGLPIHQMSVTGLVVALGIMVDNAIVMVDLIQRRYREGRRALAAMLGAIRHLWLPLLGSTLTTILAFAPIALMPGPAGEFVGGIALSVIFSLIGSYLISHTVIAGLAGRAMRACPKKESTSWLWSGVDTPKLAVRFRKVLAWSLSHPLLTLAAVLVLPIAGFVSITLMTEQFFPPADRDMFSIEARLPPQSSIRRTQVLAAEMRELLAQEPALERQSWFVGKGAPSFYYNMMSNRDGEPQFANGMIKMTDYRAVSEAIPRLQSTMTARWPEAQIVVRKLEQGPPFQAPIELRIFGPSVERLNLLGEQARRILSETPDVITTRATLEDAAPKVVVSTREEVIRQSGLERTQLAAQLQAGLNGQVRGSVLEGSEELPVRVRVGNGARETIADLGTLYVAPTLAAAATEYQGTPVTAIAELSLQPSSGAIARRNGQRVNTIEGYLRADVLPDQVLSDFTARLAADGFVLPAGYRTEFGGESSGRNDAVGNLLSSVGVILVLLVLVVVLSFNSFRISGVIFAVAGASVGLGVLCVYAAGYPFGFVVIVGLMGLMGLAINGAIVILAELKTSSAACRGEVQPIIDGVMRCTRHITSTTITTVGGFTPLIIEGGGFWPPFAIAIAGGTVLTTTLSLVFTPVAFRFFALKRAFDVTGTKAPVLSLERNAPRVEASSADRLAS